jgi:acyl-coenzyme A synthetase/AMP-(fatty) acid ligase
MNCINPFASASIENANKIAFASPGANSETFSQLREKIIRIQTTLRSKNFAYGDKLLLAMDISSDLYAIVIATMGLGGTVILVEPWMSINRISEVISLVKPKIFVSSFLGKFWGIRVSEIRNIPIWLSLKSLLDNSGRELVCEDVEKTTPGIITFTSGTSGVPKGVVREQGYLLEQFNVLKNNLHFDQYSGADLCIFANWSLLNLAQGKTTVFFPSNWSKKNFSWLEAASNEYNIQTLTSGPAFAQQLLSHTKIKTFKDIHIGGALTPIKLFIDLIQMYPDSLISQIYGSSEVEPVCMISAKESVELSLKNHFYHSLVLGQPIQEIKFENSNRGMWVTGPHVCPFYLNNRDENLKNKRKDDQNQIWHFMGDRISYDSDNNWIYSGRESIGPDDFFLEQKIYNYIRHDLAFLDRSLNGNLNLFGEGLKKISLEIKREFPQIEKVIETKIIKDKRHRARIDRGEILKRLK